ncbi:MAG: hypothetical protein K6A90_14995 [Lachnospiraceae bacterium]|nr:hypothetical protein [Lachnospiraceae bacterium]
MNDKKSRKLNDDTLGKVSGGVDIQGNTTEYQIVDKFGTVVGSYLNREEVMEEFDKYGEGYQIKEVIH